MPALRLVAHFVFATTGLVLAAASSLPATAATIQVDRVVEIAADGTCSLVEAVINAEDDRQTHADCAAGTGADTIVLLEEFDYLVTQPYAGSDNALPLITGDLIIEGQGSRILRDTSVPFRLIELAGGSFELKDLILGNGLSTSPMTGGGAILVRGGATLLIENAVFELNTAGGDSAFGGALRIDASNVEIRDSLFENNQVFTLDPLMGGGAIAQFDGFLEVRRSAFIDNKGDIVCNPIAPDNRAGGGGALRIEALTSAGAYADIYDSTFSGNIGRVGGAIDVRALLDTGVVGEDVLVRLFRSTVAENIASGCPGVDGAGAGLYVEESNGGSGLIQYGTSVIHGNGLVENGDIVGRDCFSLQSTQTFASLDGNVLDELDSCTASLQDRFADAVDDVLDMNLNGDHYLPLQAGPAFDHPDAFFNCAAGTTTDQLGKIRGNGPGQGGSACDSGAIELYVEPVLQQTLTVTLAGSGSGEVSSQPAGIQCPGVCEFDFPNNEKVILTATPGPVSEFVGWGGACTGDGICLVSMDQARDVIATFGPRPAQLVVQLLNNGSASGSVTSTSGPALNAANTAYSSVA